MRHLRILAAVDRIARTGSIRKAAEEMALTPSALNRSIQDLERELGTPIFERLSRGVRLNAAGELLLRHIRGRAADLERVRSQIEDLSGLRRGRVSIAASQALAYRFLPREIAAYRERFPLVGFDVHIRDHQDALAMLVAFEADLALVFRPDLPREARAIQRVPQRVAAVMARAHPLAAKARLRLSDLAGFPLALPGKTYGGRQILEEALARTALRLDPIVESNSFEFLRAYVATSDAVTIQIDIGTPEPERDDDLVTRPFDPRDMPGGDLVLVQLRDRALSVAAAKFAEQIGGRMEGA